MIEKVDGKRIANDINTYLISMWKELCNGWIPETFSKEQYYHIKDNKYLYPDYVVGYVGFCVSYCGKWFGGYAGRTNTKQGIRDYQDEAKRNVLKQVKKLAGVEFSSKNYYDIFIPENSVVYCDPPYNGTTEYKDSNFDSEKFWEWVRLISKGNKVFVSEYHAPEDFTCVWEKKLSSSLSANGLYGGSKESIEKLFIFSGDKT